jgi:WD40 repeat protein
VGAGGFGLVAVAALLVWILNRGAPEQQPPPADSGQALVAGLARGDPAAEAAPVGQAPSGPRAVPAEPRKLLLGTWEVMNGGPEPGRLEFVTEGDAHGIHTDGLGGLDRVFAPLKVFADFNLRPPYIAMTYRWAGADKLEITYLLPAQAPGGGFVGGPPRASAPEAFTIAVTDKQLTLTNARGTKAVFRRPGLEGFAELVDTLKGIRAGNAAFSPDGRTLAVGGSLPSPTANNLLEAVVLLWDVEGRKERARWWQNRRGEVPKGTYAPANRIEDVAFSPDGKAVVARDAVGGTAFWDTAAGKELFTVKERGPVLSPDGKLVAVLPGEKQGDPKLGVLLRDGSTGQEVARLTWDRTERIRALAFAPNGGSLGALGEGGVTVLWDLGTRAPLAQLPPGKPPTPPGLLFDKVGKPFALSFSPDGKLLAVLAEGLTLWDVEARAKVYQDDESPHPDSLLFAPDGNLLVALNVSPLPAVYALRREGPKVTVEKRPEVSRALVPLYPGAFSPDGALLFGRPRNRSGPSRLQVWLTKSWRPRTSFLGSQVTASRDGKYLAVVGGTDVQGVDVWRLTGPADE